MSVNPIYDALGDDYLLGGDVDPSLVAIEAPTGSLYIQIGTPKIWQKQDDGETTNWTELAVGDFMERDFSNALPSVNDIDLGGFKITNLADPTAAQHAATKSYVDSADSGKMNTNFSNAANAANAINLGGFQINNVGDPALAQDAATKNYVDSADSGKMNTNFSNAAASANDLNLGGFKLINLADPTNAQDAATKAYVDSSSGGANTALSNLVAVNINENLTTTKASNFQIGNLGGFATQLITGDNPSGNSGVIDIFTGDAPGNQSGWITLKTGSGAGASSGFIQIETGSGVSTSSITVNTGNAQFDSGAINLTTGNASELTSGLISIETGSTFADGQDVGNITIKTGSANGAGSNRGYIDLDALFYFAPRQDADPTHPDLMGGAVYYNTTTNKLKMYNGATWETVTSA